MRLFVISLLIDSLLNTTSSRMYSVHCTHGFMFSKRLCQALNYGGKAQFWARQGGDIVFKFCRIIKDSKGLLVGKK